MMNEDFLKQQLMLASHFHHGTGPTTSVLRASTQSNMMSASSGAPSSQGAMKPKQFYLESMFTDPNSLLTVCSVQAF